jgi:hypothetical protein
VIGEEQGLRSGSAGGGLAAAALAQVWPPRWTWSARLARTRVPALVSLIPLLGYVIILSDEFHAAAMKFEQLGGGLWFSSVGRIHLLYLGSVLVLLGLAIYWALGPRSIQSYLHSRDYVEAMVRDGAPRKLKRVYMQVVEAVSPTARPHELVEALALIETDEGRYLTYRDGPRMHQARIVFEEHWRVRDRWCPALSAASILFMGAGLALVAMPSIEVFFMAMRKVAGI